MSNFKHERFSDKLHEACHPFFLGKNRHMGDPCFSIPGTEWQARLEDEANLPVRFPFAPESSPMEHFKMSNRLQYGRTALRPGLWPDLTVSRLDNLLKKCKDWIMSDANDLAYLIRVKEVDIQEKIIGFSEEELLGHLEGSWKSAKKTFNERAPWKIQQSDRLMGHAYTLHADTDMPRFHAPDLDTFNIDFIEDDLGQMKAGEVRAENDILIPLYRFGCNYKDLRELTHPWRHNEGSPPQEQGALVEYNRDLYSHYERVRSTYLAPHINREDLMDPRYLLSFIHYRARARMEQFCSLDNDRTYPGRQLKILSGPLRVKRMTTMAPVSEKRLKFDGAYGSSLESGQNHAEYRRDYNDGYVFGGSEAYIILLSQLLTYNFLKTFCFRISKPRNALDQAYLFEVNKDLLDESPESKAVLEDVERRARARLDLLMSTQPPDPAVMRQYELVAPGIDVRRFIPRLDDRHSSAEMHILKLFNDPDYFTAAIIEEREHHWLHTRFVTPSRLLGIEKYVEKQPRHRLYLDCLRRVTRRAVFEAYLWFTTKERLQTFNQNVLAKYPGSDLKPALLNNYDLWPQPPALLNVDDPNIYKPLFKEYLRLVCLVRYHAIFFLNEFRVQAIHIGPEPFRDDFVRHGRDEFENAHYDGKPLGLQHNINRNAVTDDKCIILELIDNLIADEGASMHIGIRKVTHRLQFLLADPDDKTVQDYVTPLISETIAKLDLLADLAEHLEDWHPAVEKLGALSEADRRRLYRMATKGLSIDFLKLDEFKIDESQCVPDKRMNRLYSFLDEMQGFETGNVRTTGFARGDLKRYGASLLKNLITKTEQRAGTTEETVNQTEQTVKEAEELEDLINWLARRMAVSRNDYPFHEDEVPIDVGNVIIRQNGITREKQQPDNRHAHQAARRKGTAARRRRSSEGFAKPILETKRPKVVKRRDAKMHARLEKRKADRRRAEEARIAAAAEAAAEAAARAAAGPQIIPERMEVDDAILNMGDVLQNIALAAPVALPPPVQLPPQPIPQPAPAQPQPAPAQPQPAPAQPQPAPAQPQPAPAQPQPAPAQHLAPDGLPKRELKRGVWATIDVLYKKDTSRYPLWKEVVGLLAAMGYRDTLSGGGGHVTFTRTDRCRFPEEALPRGKSIALSTQHGSHGVNQRSRHKLRTWADTFRSNGVTYEFLEAWFCRPS